jgi:DNA-binding transcriptional LysR family regulator
LAVTVKDMALALRLCTRWESLAHRCALNRYEPSRFAYFQKKEADGAASALAFVAAGFGVAVISEPLQKIPAKNVIFRDLAPEDRAWVPVAAAWKPDALAAPVASQFIDVLAQACANGNGRSRATANSRLN